MSTPSLVKPLRVLISGAGIGGPVLAYWLGKAGVSVTVLERASRLRKEGQTVDMSDEAVTIMKWMGVEEAVRKATTKEVGVKFVNEKNKVKAAFPQMNNGASPTSEWEIVRGELAQVFYEAGKEKAEYIFGDTIAGIEETETGALVTFASKEAKAREFDMVIISEGLSSRTRAMAFGEDVRAPIKPLHMWVATFSFAQGKNDDQWARVYHIPQRKGILIRPDGFGRVRANAMVYDTSDTIPTIANSKDQTKIKEYFANLFNGTGWETDRIIEGLREADDFYLQETAQVILPTWSKGRVVLVGDTAYGPSPLSGQGCTAAIIGSYILAAEIVQHQDDHRAAFAAYETSMRPWIEDTQKILPGFPALGLPETRWGIRVGHVILYIVTLIVKSGIFDVVSPILDRLATGRTESKLKLPNPSVFEQK